MRIEKRKVTIEKEVYIASDGTEFEDEDLCEGHEYTLIENRLGFYDREGYSSSIDRCSYVYLTTKEEISDFLSLCKWTGITSRGIESEGLYFYTDKGWINISNPVKKILKGAKNDQT